MPTFRVSVPESLYGALSLRMGEPFAASYLFGAQMSGMRLTPRTLTAYYALSRSHDCRALLKDLNVTLERPIPFGSPGASQITLENHFG